MREAQPETCFWMAIIYAMVTLIRVPLHPPRRGEGGRKHGPNCQDHGSCTTREGLSSKSREAAETAGPMISSLPTNSCRTRAVFSFCIMRCRPKAHNRRLARLRRRTRSARRICVKSASSGHSSTLWKHLQALLMRPRWCWSFHRGKTPAVLRRRDPVGGCGGCQARRAKGIRMGGGAACLYLASHHLCSRGGSSYPPDRHSVGRSWATALHDLPHDSRPLNRRPFPCRHASHRNRLRV